MSKPVTHARLCRRGGATVFQGEWKNIHFSNTSFKIRTETVQQEYPATEDRLH